MRDANKNILKLTDSDLFSLLGLLKVIQEVRSSDTIIDAEAIKEATMKLGAAVLQSDIYCFGTQIEPAVLTIEAQLIANGWNL